jgi:sugar phosphate isomerase/epimerase
MSDQNLSLTELDAIAERGIDAIECGEFRLVSSDESRHSLLDDLNKRAAERAKEQSC